MIRPRITPNGERLNRNEAHDLSVLVGARAKVLRHEAVAQAAALKAELERNLASIFSFDQDETWTATMREADRVVAECQRKVEQRCRELHIPRWAAPSIQVHWYGRGESALASRRVELRKAGETKIDAMLKATISKIEKQAVELRTEIVAQGRLSPQAKRFLESLAPIEQEMRAIDVAALDRQIDHGERRRLSYQRGGQA